MGFYRGLVENLRAWQPAPPKLPAEPDEKPAETPTPTPPPFTAEEREVGEAADPTAVVSGRPPEQQ